MVECGNIDTPPSKANITIWGIVELILMVIIGLLCFFGFFDILRYSDINVWSIINLIGNGFGIAGLVFIILGLWQSNASYIKIGIVCFLVSILIYIVCLVYGILSGAGISFKNLFSLLLNLFMAYVLWRQSSHL